jgi:hypothetical protein
MAKDFYQMILAHGELGSTPEAHPTFDMGVMGLKEGTYLAEALTTASGHADTYMFEGTTINVLQAWGNPEYRFWALPLHDEQCVEACYQFAERWMEVPADQDPR